ncbi:hypothetical protein LWI29_019372 [Acer saccharum]|uniref:Auxin-responsive protein n=1 Tax=Acer saccharum TaxID=4024 RepID=A0AA39SR74_ACESA|nr:hypothetical protein LWI29_019372 [Acer saccharum]
MEGGSSMNGETRPQLLDLIPKEREWLMMRESGERRHHGSSEEKLELRLGPPGGEDWSLKDNNNRERDESLLSLSYFSSMNNNQNISKTRTTTMAFHIFISQHQQKHPKQHHRACLSWERNHHSPVALNSQKRTAPAPVVGWPPIRSFRKNLASTSASKPSTESSPNGRPPCSSKRFQCWWNGEQARGRESDHWRFGWKWRNTLVYEDNEGDRMLVGDVPWHMFVSTVKRLRVLKSSEVSALSLGSSKQAKIVA